MSGQDLNTHPYEIAPHASGLDALLNSPVGLSFPLDLDEILSTTCKAAVDLLKVDHSGLMVFDSKYDKGYVIAEYPPIGTKSLTIPLRGVPAEERMVNFKEPIALPNIADAPSFSPVSRILSDHGIKSVLVVPLINKNKLIGSLGLDMICEVREFTDEEIKLCQVFAQQAAAVIDLYEQNRQKAEQLEAIRSTALALTSYEDLRSLLDTITYQAVQLLGAEDGGVSQFNPERGELTAIADYHHPEMIGTTIKMGEGLAGRVMMYDRPFMAVADYNSWPYKAPAYARTQRFGAVLIINLKWQNRTVGVLYINAKRGRDFEREFGREMPPFLSLLASTAAIAIANVHLVHEAETARQRIHSSYEASSALSSLPDSGQVLQDVAYQALEAASASSVRLLLVGEGDRWHSILAAKGSKSPEIDDKATPDEISIRVLKTGVAYRCEDVAKVTGEFHPTIVEAGSRAAFCLPLSSTDRRHGVIWIHYSQPRTFSQKDEEALAVYLKQAVIAYTNARQMEELEPLRLAAEGLAAAGETQEVLKRIVVNAREVLHSDYAIIWPYAEGDAEGPRELLVREAVTSGIDEALLDEMWGKALPVGELTRSVMHEGWVGIRNVDDSTAAVLPEVSLKLLRRLGAKSLEGLGLVVAGEKLSVLYLAYKSPRDFHPDEIRMARTFATHAALALKKAKLVSQVAKAQKLAFKVAELTALVDLEKTLNGVVASTMETLQCDAVTLFIYDEETGRILPLTTMTGVWDMKLATHCEDAPRDSIVYKMLSRDEPYCVPRVADDALFREQHFVKREAIESVCAIPLKINEHRVGVMFINYRSPHRFTKEDLYSLEIFAHQAAIAIRNGLRYEEQNEKLREQQFLLRLSEQLLGAKSLKDTLTLSVRAVANLLGAEFVAVVLQNEEGHFRFKEWLGWTQEDVKEYELGNGEKYQTGYTIKQRSPVFVTNYASEKRFIVPSIVRDRNIKSSVSVPMYVRGDKPVGAMLAHFTETRAFTEAEARALSLIANLTAIAVQHHGAVESKLASLEAVQRATDEISKIRLGTPQKKVLNMIVQQAVHCLPQAFLGTIQRYDSKKNVLRFESVYPKRADNDEIFSLDGKERLIDRRQVKRIGIAGRAVLERKPQLVDNVLHDPDYFTFSEETRSELAVPLLSEENSVLGVLNVESKRLSAFNKDDAQALMALAKLVVTTIQNAEQYDLLEETRLQVHASTMLAWFGLASSVWGHSVAGNALNIRDNVTLLRSSLEKYAIEPDLQKLLDDKLNVIKDLATRIRQLPVTSLLSFSDGVSDVSVNDLIRDRVQRLRRHFSSVGVVVSLELAEGDGPYVRCSPEWIRRMLDLLIDNALDAMVESVVRVLTIGTKVVDDQVEITVTDTGRGLSPELKEKLFRQRIEKQTYSKGLGMGLLIVQAIAQNYKGRAGVHNTGPGGTTVYVRLPAGHHR